MNIPKFQLKLFLEKRNELIKKLSSREIDKISFLEQNYNLIKNLNMKPLLDISTIEEGMYNYQYYNILAKYYRQRATSCSSNKKKQKKYNENMNKSKNYYMQKDKQLLKMLKLVNSSQIESYFVKMHSKKLNNNLFEIVLKNIDFAIFHSMNIEILNLLKEKNVFLDIIKESKIDEYVNTNI